MTSDRPDRQTSHGEVTTFEEGVGGWLLPSQTRIGYGTIKVQANSVGECFADRR